MPSSVRSVALSDWRTRRVIRQAERVLQPGIEYFGVADDEAAIAFAEGLASREVHVVRADGFGPDFPMAVFGALLTGRRIAELAEEPELHTVAVEDRGATAITVFRMPDVVSDALASSDDSDLADVARRSHVYAELAGVPTEFVTDLLVRLAGCAREGRLYARVVHPTEASHARRPSVDGIRRALPWIGLVVTLASVIAAFVVITRSTPALYFPMLIGGAILANISIGVLIARRRTRRLRNVADRSLGSTAVTVAAGPAFRAALTMMVAEVLGPEAAVPSSPGDALHLVADPSGLDLVFADDRTVHIPATVILGLAASECAIPVHSIGSPSTVVVLDIVLRVDAQESVVWEVPIAHPTGGTPHLEEIVGLAAKIAAIVGARSVGTP